MRNGGAAARIAVIPGDGIGKEVTPQAVKVLRAVAGPAKGSREFVEFDWSADKYLRDGVSLPAGAVEMLRDEFDAILFGALGDPRVPSNQHAADILLGLRFKLDLYVNARPVELLHDRLTPLRDRTEKDIRLMVFRENTEGLYVGVGGFFKKGTPDEIAVQVHVNYGTVVERNFRYACEYPRQNGFKRVCMGDNSNAIALQAILACIFERVADDALDPFAGIDVLLNRNLVRRVFLEEPANAHVQPLGVLPENHQADVFFRAIAQRRQPVVEQFDGSCVDVQVELEAQAQQDIRRVLLRRHAWIPERAEENRVKFVAQHFDGARRE